MEKKVNKKGEMPVKGWCFEICAFNTSEKVPSPFFEMSLRTGRNSLTMTLMMGETQGIEKQTKKNNSKSSESRSKICRSNSISQEYYELKPQHKGNFEEGKLAVAISEQHYAKPTQATRPKNYNMIRLRMLSI